MVSSKSFRFAAEISIIGVSAAFFYTDVSRKKLSTVPARRLITLFFIYVSARRQFNTQIKQ